MEFVTCRPDARCNRAEPAAKCARSTPVVHFGVLKTTHCTVSYFLSPMPANGTLITVFAKRPACYRLDRQAKPLRRSAPPRQIVAAFGSIVTRVIRVRDHRRIDSPDCRNRRGLLDLLARCVRVVHRRGYAVDVRGDESSDRAARSLLVALQQGTNSARLRASR